MKSYRANIVRNKNKIFLLNMQIYDKYNLLKRWDMIKWK